MDCERVPADVIESARFCLQWIEQAPKAPPPEYEEHLRALQLWNLRHRPNEPKLRQAQKDSPEMPDSFKNILE